MKIEKKFCKISRLQLITKKIHIKIFNIKLIISYFQTNKSQNNEIFIKNFLRRKSKFLKNTNKMHNF